MRVRSSQRFGATAFCREIDVALAELSVLLEKADALGLYNDSRVVTGHTVYNYNTDFWTTKWFYVPGLQADACTKDANEVVRAAVGVRAAITESGATAPDPIRPDYQPSEGSPFGLIPWWIPVVAIGGLLAYLGFRVPRGRSLSGWRRRKLR